jgi:Fic family protein
MFKPTYRITPFLLRLLEKISAEKVFIGQIGQKTPLKLSIIRDSFNRSVHSSTWIEGNMLSLAQVAALSANKAVAGQAQQKLEVKNCIKALRWILKKSNTDLSQEKLLKIHSLMMNGLLKSSRIGKYRDIQNYIVNANNKVIFTPPAPAKVKKQMKELFVWLKQNPKEHPIIRSALFHHRFAEIHPFVDGNGRVTRAASQWLLFEKDYDPIWTLGLDEFFAQDRDKYYEMIRETDDMDGDYTYWIEYTAEGLLKAIQTVSKRLKEGQRNLKLTPTPKQIELLTFLEKKGSVGSAEIAKTMNINRARVNQLIAPLVKAKIVHKEGTARAVRYSL